MKYSYSVAQFCNWLILAFLKRRQKMEMYLKKKMYIFIMILLIFIQEEINLFPLLVLVRELIILFVLLLENL